MYALKKTFNKVDYLIFAALWRWAKRRHPNKSAKWIKAKYFRKDILRDWMFFAPSKNSEGVNIPLDLAKTSKVSIKRHIKIRAEATPYDPKYHDYFGKRLSHNKPKWWVCWWDLAS
jgi:RNA-directed DNA polymerase